MNWNRQLKRPNKTNPRVYWPRYIRNYFVISVLAKIANKNTKNSREKAVVNTYNQSTIRKTN